MSFSARLIEELKARKGFTKDAEIVVVLPKVTKGIFSEIKNGKRNLTEEQAVWIAEQCDLNLEWVLVNLAEDTAKNDKAKKVWSRLAKSLAKTVNALAIIGIVLFSQASPPNSPQRIKNVP